MKEQDSQRHHSLSERGSKIGITEHAVLQQYRKSLQETRGHLLHNEGDMYRTTGIGAFWADVVANALSTQNRALPQFLSNELKNISDDPDMAPSSKGFFTGMASLVDSITDDPRYGKPLPSLPRSQDPEKVEIIKAIQVSVHEDLNVRRSLNPEHFDELVVSIADMVFDEDYDAFAEASSTARLHLSFYHKNDMYGAGSLFSAYRFIQSAGKYLPPPIIRIGETKNPNSHQQSSTRERDLVSTMNLSIATRSNLHPITTDALLDLYRITKQSDEGGQGFVLAPLETFPQDAQGPLYPPELLSLRDADLLDISPAGDNVYYAPSERGRWLLKRFEGLNIDNNLPAGEDSTDTH